eukprot:1417821-Pyramimonas_sp.AAC.1
MGLACSHFPLSHYRHPVFNPQGVGDELGGGFTAVEGGFTAVGDGFTAVEGGFTAVEGGFTAVE